MFSVQQKRDISDAVQRILRATNHPELPETGEISFTLHVEGAADWSWADIKNNGAVGDPGINPHNELIASMSEEEGRALIEQAEKIAAHPDPRATPDDFVRDMLDKQIVQLNKAVDRLEQRDQIKDKLYSEVNARLEKLEEFLTPVMEDNLIAYHSTQLNNLMTAIRQLGNKEINENLKGG